MRILTSFLLLASLLMAQSALALICPKTYATVKVGMTMAAVKAICGEPTTIRKQSGIKTTQQRVEHWSYGTASQGQSVMLKAQRDLGYQSAPEEVKQFSFDQHGKLIQIVLNGTVMSQARVCGSTINVGDPKRLVSGKCGTPTVKSVGNVAAYGGAVESVIWVYQFDPYGKSTTVQFEQDKVISIN